MSVKGPRSGIEWKILTSILWVGILPMALALILGYIAVRGSRSEYALDTLLTSVTKTTEGIGLSSKYRLEEAASLASDDIVTRALTPDASGKLPHLEEEFRSRFATFSRGSAEAP